MSTKSKDVFVIAKYGTTIDSNYSGDGIITTSSLQEIVKFAEDNIIDMDTAENWRNTIVYKLIPVGKMNIKKEKIRIIIEKI